VRASVPPSGAHIRGLPGRASTTAPSGATVDLTTRPSNLADVFVDPGHGLTFQLATAGPNSTLFNISGGASTGHPVANDRISLLGPGQLYLDTTQPGTVRCLTSYSRATPRSIAGTTTCRLLPPSEQSGTVTVTFSVGR